MTDQLPFTTNEVDRAMITARTINAPAELVYKLFATKKIDLWYGPKGCHIVTKQLQFVEGGQWDYTMHMPNGKSFDAFHTYTKLVENEKIEFISAQQPDAPKDQWFTTEIDFIPKDNQQTEVRVTMSYKSDAMFEQAREYGAIKGYISALEKLAEYVEKEF